MAKKNLRRSPKISGTTTKCSLFTAVVACILSALAGTLITLTFVRWSEKGQIVPHDEQRIVGTKEKVVRVPRNQPKKGWTYGNKKLCKKSLYVHKLLDDEKMKRRLSPATLEKLTRSFKHCGVAVIEKTFDVDVINKII